MNSAEQAAKSLIIELEAEKKDLEAYLNQNVRNEYVAAAVRKRLIELPAISEFLNKYTEKKQK